MTPTRTARRITSPVQPPTWYDGGEDDLGTPLLIRPREPGGRERPGVGGRDRLRVEDLGAGAKLIRQVHARQTRDERAEHRQRHREERPEPRHRHAPHRTGPSHPQVANVASRKAADVARVPWRLPVIPPDEPNAKVTSRPFSRREIAVLAASLVVGVLVRLLLLPTDGMRQDIDVFVGWVHHIATNGLTTLYGETATGPVTFGPVMAYVWGILAAIEPGFRVATDGSDAGIRVLMKLPPTLAEFGMAALIAFALRDRPRWATVGAAVILLHPALIYLSAWWGQYESVYLLSALAATILAINGRNGWAAVLIAVSVMTKPQALPMLVPFAAWFWATDGWRGFARAGLIGAATIAVLWLPFIPENGPLNYLGNLAYYQTEAYAFLSLWAWNLWWLVQEVMGGGYYVPDNITFVGPFTVRHVGLVVTGILEAAVALAVIRDPRPRTLILALVTSVLVAFSFLTTMHERYDLAAVVLMLLLLPEPRFRWLNLTLGIVVTLNVLATVPPSVELEQLLTRSLPLRVLGSLAILTVTTVAYLMLTRPKRPRMGADPSLYSRA